jgi:hypothetical protein
MAVCLTITSQSSHAIKSTITSMLVSQLEEHSWTVDILDRYKMLTRMREEIEVHKQSDLFIVNFIHPKGRFQRCVLHSGCSIFSFLLGRHT